METPADASRLKGKWNSMLVGLKPGYIFVVVWRCQSLQQAPLLKTWCPLVVLFSKVVAVFQTCWRKSVTGCMFLGLVPHPSLSVFYVSGS